MLKRIFILLILFAVLFIHGSALAQAYSYRIPKYTADVYWNEDGTVSIDYVFVFQNEPGGHAIEFVDLGMPREDFDAGSITAEVDGQPASNISTSEYQGDGPGVGIDLRPHAIPPGATGTVHVFIGRVDRMYEPDPGSDDYGSAVFAPAYFKRPNSVGTTDMTVTFHLPPGVQPDEPRWHKAPNGFPSEPETGLDDQGRIIYSWRNTQANPSGTFPFGASFPTKYIPASAVRPPTPRGLPGWLIPIACIGFFGLIIALGIVGENKRKMKYLPPKIAIEGHGIKRGLTAVEAAILLEQAMDKILTMILFGVIKKGAAQVVTREPLEVKAASPMPEGLRDYEKLFLQAFSVPKGRERSRAMQEMMVGLVKEVAAAMKGFSRRETVEYYRDITRRAWDQVEAADTPEVKSEKYDEVMEWTMLDRDYDRRTRDVFGPGPVFLPHWWGRFDPGFGGGGAASTPRTSTTSLPGGGPSGGGISLPNLPGSQFAASITGGVQSFASGVVGNISEFTGRITQQTNPPPKPASTSGGGGGTRGGGGGRSCACACACACAGCACACAGGGR